MIAFSRREVLLALAAARSAHGFVLVHGAWHGGWCWDAVVRGLEARGQRALAPTLSGDGTATLATHVDEVVKAAGAFERVTLVGHSYAGLVISQAFGALNVERLVYLDAFLPSPGQSGFDLMKKEYGERWRARVKNGLVPPMLSAKAMGVDDPAVDTKLRGHPVATFEAKVQFDDEKWKALKKTYIRAAKYAGFGPTAVRAKALGLEVREVDAGHDAMLAAPDALVAMLVRE